MEEYTVTSLFEKQVKTALDKLLSVAVAEICHIYRNISNGTLLSDSLCDRTQSVMECQMRNSSENFLKEHVKVQESPPLEECVGIQTEDRSHGVSATSATSDTNSMLEADLRLPLKYETVAIELNFINLQQEGDDDKTLLFPEPVIVSCTSLNDDDDNNNNDNDIQAENKILQEYILSPVSRCALSEKEQDEKPGPLAEHSIVEPVHESTPKEAPPTIECPKVQTKAATQSKQRSVDDTDKESDVDNSAQPRYEPPVLRRRRGSSSLKPGIFEKSKVAESGMEVKCKPTQSTSSLPTQVSGHLEYCRPLTSAEHIMGQSTVSLSDHHHDNILTHSSVLPSVPTVTAPHLSCPVSTEPISHTLSADRFKYSDATAPIMRRSALPPGPVTPASPEHASDLKPCSVRLEVTPRLRRLAQRCRRSRLLVCGECGKTFGQKRKLRRHRRFHTGERPHGCSHCGRSFILRSTLKSHERVHTGEKPFSCKDCSKTFRSAQRLTSHTRFHTGEKPYGCPECGKRFRVKGNLNKHVLTHTVEKLEN